MSKKSKQQVVRAPSKRQMTKWQRERRVQKMFIIGVALVIALAIAVPVYGYYREVIARGQEIIAAVNDKTLSMDQYVRLLSLRQYEMDLQLSYLNSQAGQSSNSQLAQQLQFQRALLPTQAVYDWADGEVIVQSAQQMGITVSSDEVWQEIKRQLLGDPKPDEKVDETKRDADAQDALKRIVDATGVTQDEFKRTVEVSLLQQKVDEQLRSKIVTPTLQVRVQLILTDDEDSIQSAYKRIQGGEDFATVAKDVSVDTNSKDKGGELGWVPKGLRSAEFDNTVFAMNPGQMSEPFKSEEGYYIVKVLERNEAKDLDAQTLDLVKAGALQRWLDEEKGKYKIDYHISSDKQAWAQDKITKDRAKKAKQTQQQPLQ